MRVLDSRRLTGPGLVLDHPGAVIDLEVDPSRRDQAVAAWREAVSRLLAGVGWGGESVRVRQFGSGVSLAFTAPPDVLYAATEVNEAAWAAAEAALEGRPPAPEADEVARLRRAIDEEANPALLALRNAARERGVTFLHGEGQVSVGSGRGVRTWPASALPTPSEVAWDDVFDVPVALVTGSNGKTTVVRLLAALAGAGGKAAGITSTDAVMVAGRVVDQGDYSGPGGARLLLRQPDLEVAVLETARGGLLRRGLALCRADAAVVTNVADDHLGEFGVETLAALAETKLLVARAIGADGLLALNADDPALVSAAAELRAPLAWFSLDPDRRPPGGGALFTTVERGRVVRREGGRVEDLVAVEEIPLAMGGAARHNLANLLAAVAVAGRLGVDAEAIRRILRRFGREPSDNPGRANLLDLGGFRVLVDYAHNPHGFHALAGITSAIRADRRLVLLGQAGDRSDAALRDLARAALALKPDRVIVKEMDRYLRGRAPGEVPAILATEFRRLGVPGDRISEGGGELAATREALAWARPGDLLVLALHQDRDDVVAMLERVRAAGWRAGDPLPA